MAAKFKVGDLVQHIDGAERMRVNTVSDADPAIYGCSWKDRHGDLQTRDFSEEVLKVAPPPFKGRSVKAKSFG